jgi:hypothetical protein
MPKPKAEIVADIENYVRSCGGAYPQWYAGIAGRPRDRLFNAHAVKEKGDAWIFRECPNAETARVIEEFFISRGMDGGVGGGDSATKCVYVYRKTSSTVE